MPLVTCQRTTKGTVASVRARQLHPGSSMVWLRMVLPGAMAVREIGTASPRLKYTCGTVLASVFITGLE
jgi:hypothetical protein